MGVRGQHGDGMIAAFFLAATMGSPAAALSPTSPLLLPTPAHISPAAGVGFVMGRDTRIVTADAAGRAAAERLRQLMASAGVAIGSSARSGPVVSFVRDDSLPAEAYRLTSAAAGATITASDEAGLIHGAVTLWQLATGAGGNHRVPALTIEDHPRFAWRGLMLDSARHFQSPAYIRHLLDWMMAAKLNRFHWHLVDDQGWRLPVPGWPRLTEVSAWRRDATVAGTPPLPLEGGFYSEADIRSIVAYAEARGIAVVPEIEMPGHALSAIRAYPELGMGVPIPPGTESDYGVFPWLYNTDERTFAFLEQVLSQTMRLFPGPWIHIGGDEATKEQWRASPAIQAQIKRLGLKDEDALQGWFTARIGRFLASHGRRLLGWDEILDGGVPADATILSWRGIDGATKAAKAGHDAILSPAPTLYLNNRQGQGTAEPPSHGTLIELRQVLAFDPSPAGLSLAEQAHILGLQANLWTEHVRTEERAAWMTFPRALAVAEIGWAPAAPRTVASFLPTMVAQLDRMTPLGLHAADSAVAIDPQLDLRSDGRVDVTLANQAELPIHYTLDGTAPIESGPLYAAPLAVAAGTRLRAASFLGSRALAGSYDATVTTAAALTRSSRELTLCSRSAPLDLEDDFPAAGTRAHFLIDILNPCWQWRNAPSMPARSVALWAGALPFNFQVGADREKIRFRPPATPAGEFVVHDGDCAGPAIAILPLAPAAGRPGVTRLTAPIGPRRASADLCINYTARGPDPLWAIDRIELIP